MFLDVAEFADIGLLLLIRQKSSDTTLIDVFLHLPSIHQHKRVLNTTHLLLVEKQLNVRKNISSCTTIHRNVLFVCQCVK